MNLLGKIFTLIVLLLSVVFLTVSVAVFQTHRDWRAIALANKKTIDGLLDQVKIYEAQIQVQKDRLAVEQAARRYALAALQTKAEKSDAELQVLGQSLAQLQNQAGQLSAVTNTQAQTMETVVKQNEDLRKGLQDAQLARDKVFGDVVALTDAKNGLEGSSQLLKERNDDLNRMYTLAKGWLDRLGVDMHSPIDRKAPKVEGQIVSVGEKDLLEISIGEDDGLKEGHSLEVFRAGSYLGRVVVQRTWPDRAVVKIIPEFRRGIIKVGDRVATKLG